jgi:hypothetical protein
MIGIRADLSSKNVRGLWAICLNELGFYARPHPGLLPRGEGGTWSQFLVASAFGFNPVEGLKVWSVDGGRCELQWTLALPRVNGLFGFGKASAKVAVF